MVDIGIIEDAIENRKFISFNYKSKQGNEAFYILLPLNMGKSKKGNVWVNGIIRFKVGAEDFRREPKEPEEGKEQIIILPRFSINKIENLKAFQRLFEAFQIGTNI